MSRFPSFCLFFCFPLFLFLLLSISPSMWVFPSATHNIISHYTANKYPFFHIESFEFRFVLVGEKIINFEMLFNNFTNLQFFRKILSQCHDEMSFSQSVKLNFFFKFLIYCCYTCLFALYTICVHVRAKFWLFRYPHSFE